MCKFKNFRFSSVFIILVFFAANADAKLCGLIGDFYDWNGCEIVERDLYDEPFGYSSTKVRVYARSRIWGSPDPSRVVHIVGPYEVPNTAPLGLEIIEGEIEAIKNAGFDVVYYDFSDSNNDLVQNKSAALVQAMKRFDSARGSVQPSAMIGISMGGVVGRYALRQMELNGYKHGVRYFISYDSPHKGANISRSLQYIPYFIKKGIERAINDNDDTMSVWGPVIAFADFLGIDEIIQEFGWDIEEIRDGWAELNGSLAVMNALISDQVDSPAAKQMLVHNIFAPEGGYSERNNLLAELDELGLPQGTSGFGITNIALVKGSLSGNDHSVNESYYFDYNNYFNGSDGLKRLTIRPKVLGASTVRIFPNGSGGQPRYQQESFYGRLEYKDASGPFDGGGSTDDYVLGFSLPVANDPQDLKEDLFPCSTLPLSQTIAEAINKQISTMPIDLNYDDFVQNKVDRTCFISTLSAMAVDSESDLVPFHITYGSSANNKHEQFEAGTLRLGGNGNLFIDDLKHVYLPQVLAAGWSASAPPPVPSEDDCTWQLLGSSGGYNFTVKEYRSVNACQHRLKQVYRIYENGSYRTDITYAIKISW